MDRVRSTSNPYCSTATASSIKWTYYGSPDGSQPGYDALGRPVLLTNPDALGHLVAVIEPGNLRTDYSFNAFGDLLSVTQNGLKGEAPRTRGFQYDSFGRLKSSSNPETGTVTYTYDNHGNLSKKTDARGMGSIYKYDALNRLLTNTCFSPSGTNSFPIAQYYYDGNYPRGLAATAGGNQIGRFSGAHHWSNNGNGSQDETQTYDAMGRVAVRTEYAPSGAVNSSSKPIRFCRQPDSPHLPKRPRLNHGL